MVNTYIRDSDLQPNIVVTVCVRGDDASLAGYLSPLLVPVERDGGLSNSLDLDSRNGRRRNKQRNVRQGLDSYWRQ